MTPLIDIFVVLLVLVAAAAYLVYVYRPADDAAGWRGRVARFLLWLRSLHDRWVDWRDRPRGPGPSDTGPPLRPVRPAPARPAGPRPAGGDSPLTGVVIAPGEVPAAFAPGIAWLEAFEPESDGEVMDLSRGLAAYALAYAQAVDVVAERCMTEIRLDPMSVAGMADHADEAGELAHSALGMARQFLAVYAEVLEFKSHGGVLPKDGDFLTAEGA